MLTCPVCETLLRRHDKVFACANNHSFDIARQGYVNLLLSNQKKSLNPGDNKEMVRSRQQFLAKDHYLPLAQLLNTAVAEYLKQSGNQRFEIADLGCGVGYYLSKLQAQLGSQTIGYWGVDISKEAVHCASSHKSINWVVSSTKKLPFESQSLDVLICIFAPSYLEEMMRVLKPSGRIFVITPGEQHLKEIRDLLYDEVNSKDDEKILEKTQGVLTLESNTPLEFSIALQANEDIENLIRMTPFYWRMSKEKQEQFKNMVLLNVTIDVNLWCFRLAQ